MEGSRQLSHKVTSRGQYNGQNKSTEQGELEGATASKGIRHPASHGNGRRGEGAAADRHREEVAGRPPRRVLRRSQPSRRRRRATGAQRHGDGRRARLPRRARPRGLLAPRARPAHGRGGELARRGDCGGGGQHVRGGGVHGGWRAHGHRPVQPVLLLAGPSRRRSRDGGASGEPEGEADVCGGGGAQERFRRAGCNREAVDGTCLANHEQQKQQALNKSEQFFNSFSIEEAAFLLVWHREPDLNPAVRCPTVRSETPEKTSAGETAVRVRAPASPRRLAVCPSPSQATALPSRCRGSIYGGGGTESGARKEPRLRIGGESRIWIAGTQGDGVSGGYRRQRRHGGCSGSAPKCLQTAPWFNYK